MRSSTASGVRSALAALMAAIAVAGVMTVAGDAAAQTAKAGPPSGEAEAKAYWQGIYRDAIERERKAEARLLAAERHWKTGRSRNRLRGEEREKAWNALEEARAELSDARRDLETIPEEARRAGALPGWFRDLE